MGDVEVAIRAWQWDNFEYWSKAEQYYKLTILVVTYIRLVHISTLPTI